MRPIAVIKPEIAEAHRHIRAVSRGWRKHNAHFIEIRERAEAEVTRLNAELREAKKSSYDKLNERIIKAIRSHPIAKDESLGMEPIFFEHEGIECRICRGGTGAWCGYVKLPPKHPFTHMHYRDIPIEHVHGGLTYGCDGWIGFDCAHYMDETPLSPDPSAIYRTEKYVIDETKRLAEQVIAAMKEAK